MTRNRALNIALITAAVAALVISALVAVLAFTSDGDTRDSGDSGDPFTNAEAVGCALSSQPYDTDEIYVQSAKRCTNGGVFYVFGNNEGRDAWVETATTFGTTVTDSGDRWVYVENP